MRATGSVMTVALSVVAVSCAARAAGGGALGIKPDPRAVECGLYIQPVAPARRATGPNSAS